MDSTVKEDSKEGGDYKECSNRSTCNGLFLNLEVVVYVYKYI